MELTRDRIVALVGLNAAGKSTLCYLFSGLMKPDGGTVRFEAPRPARPLIGYVHQDYRSSLYPG